MAVMFALQKIFKFEFEFEFQFQFEYLAKLFARLQAVSTLCSFFSPNAEEHAK
jgi:hypothetical protein